MGLSLQEQLLKAGVVDKKQVKKAEHEKRVQNNRKKKGQGAPAPDNKAKLLLQQQQAEQARLDRQLNAERVAQEKYKADRAAARQLIEKHRQPLTEGDDAYSYVVDGKIRKIYTTTEIADKLSAGKLAVVRHQNDLVLISAATALKVLERDEAAILIYNDPAALEDDYPDDW